MHPVANSLLNWRQGLRAVAGVWKGLVAYELLFSFGATLMLGPLLLALSYKLLGLLDSEADDFSVLTNEDLLWFLLSPQGLLAIGLVGSITVGLLFLEYAGLILLAGGALRGAMVSIRSVVMTIVRATPSLFVMAAAQTVLLMVAAIPFLGLAALTYWLLLSSADINFYLAERPPKFWVAVTIGCALAAGYLCTVVWVLVRWAFAIPVCVLEGEGGIAALRASVARTRGRRWRLTVGIAGWEVLKHAALAVQLFTLDHENRIALMHSDEGLGLMVAKTLALLLLDAVAIEMQLAFFAIGLAGFIAYEYEQSRRAVGAADVATTSTTPTSVVRNSQQTGPGRRIATMCLFLLGPTVALGSAILLEREFMAGEFLDRRGAQVTAHRAGPRPAPENSFAALALGLAAGADVVELDVQLTADGQVVLMHDRDLRRMTGDARDLADVTLADLADLRLRAGDQPTEERTPTLAQFIAACDDRIRLNIELKDFGRSEGLAMAVLDALREHNFTERAVVTSFPLAPLAELRAAEPQLPVGVILSAKRGDVTRLPVNLLSVNHRLVNGDLVRRAHRQGQQVYVWTVNDRELALRLLDIGCDNLITSDPALMREIVDWHAGLSDVSRMLLRLRRWMRE
jgi:glycerophosphoryl diester phosphodiesterase